MHVTLCILPRLESDLHGRPSRAKQPKVAFETGITFERFDATRRNDISRFMPSLKIESFSILAGTINCIVCAIVQSYSRLNFSRSRSPVHAAYTFQCDLTKLRFTLFSTSLSKTKRITSVSIAFHYNFNHSYGQTRVSSVVQIRAFKSRWKKFSLFFYPHEKMTFSLDIYTYICITYIIELIK